MATNSEVATNTEFEKLLADAPLARDADSVTVVGTLARTADPGHFILTLTDSRTLKLSVDAVKSSKLLAGAIGQSIVELELDANFLSKDVRELILSLGLGGPKVTADIARKPLLEFVKPQSHPLAELTQLPQPSTGLPHHNQATSPAAPFVVATPHQAPQIVIDALRQAAFIKPLWADPNTGPFGEVTHPAAYWHLHSDYTY